MIEGTDYFLLDKRMSETPLEALHRLRADKKISEDVPLTYAGRLDPMASGLLLVLAGDACKQKEQYLGLPKTYEACFVVGIETDSGDVLGLPNVHSSKVREHNLFDAFASLSGEHDCLIPSYASVPVNGKPLHVWTREGRLDEVERPLRKMRVHEATPNATGVMNSIELKRDVYERISAVTGDFRQEEILCAWKKLPVEKTWPFVSGTLQVDSGVYIRSLAGVLGARLSTPVVLFRLRRTTIGPFSLSTLQS